ncbi:2,3-bisphosphoglycerate-dependent phosphoglycerate mutase [Elsinoe australis]|uniref:2,3-bisphosphoglycerate-dependent phosphoglycerate mutase n=1 Tax=Elsinoe australis TaxID=40998 RepID=A0A2P7YC21_9PEZI|nr:2,3-bisphosphoglycerate-dependent phosphoglycerate mutase [Elsinoe australis]
MTTPRVFIIRHGETEWSLNGRHTGTTDIPLTSNGEKRIRATGHALVGDDRLIVPKNLAHIYVSPRQRAQRTLELLDVGCKDAYPGAAAPTESARSTEARVQVTEDVREWDYGDYEGVTSKEIKAQRKERGEREWDIWRDGCPGGESPQQVTDRLDGVIREIRENFHKNAIGRKREDLARPYDVLVVAHGHILRAFAARWIGRNIADNPGLILEAGGVGTLSYEHHSLDEPAILLGGAFMADLVQEAEKK